MSFDHTSAATNGLYPDKVSLESIVSFGMFYAEITIEPDFIGGSGSAFPVDAAKPVIRKYNIRIVIKIGNKRFEKQFNSIGYSKARMIAKFVGKELPEYPIVSASISDITIPQCTVEANYVNKTKT